MCGIYIFKRIEGAFKFCYVGQAKTIEERIYQHYNGCRSRLDNSLKKRGKEWTYEVIECPEKELDKNESYWIVKLANEGWQLYNETFGGQHIKGGYELKTGRRADVWKQKHKDTLQELRQLKKEINKLKNKK